MAYSTPTKLTDGSNSVITGGLLPVVTRTALGAPLPYATMDSTIVNIASKSNDIITQLDNLKTDLEASIATNTTNITNVSDAQLSVHSMGNAMYPVGSIFTSATHSTVAAVEGLFGGTWLVFGTGRVLVGYDAGATEFDAAGKEGGEKTHTLTIAEIPSHTHTYQEAVDNADTSGRRNPRTIDQRIDSSDTGATGGGGAHNNLQPYIVVYMYKRNSLA